MGVSLLFVSGLNCEVVTHNSRATQNGLMRAKVERRTKAIKFQNIGQIKSIASGRSSCGLASDPLKISGEDTTELIRGAQHLKGHWELGSYYLVTKLGYGNHHLKGDAHAT